MLRGIKYQTGKAKEIAFFPLSIIVLPNEKIPLRIFEPRYIELINRIEFTGEPFAIPYINNSQVTNIGSIVKLNKITNRYADGQMLITIEGIQFCEIIDFNKVLPEKQYGGGTVMPFPIEIYTYNKTIIYYLKLLEWDDDDSVMLSETIGNVFGIIQKLHLTHLEKYAILSQNDKQHTESILITYLKYYKMIYIQEKLLNHNFDLN